MTKRSNPFLMQNMLEPLNLRKKKGLIFVFKTYWNRIFTVYYNNMQGWTCHRIYIKFNLSQPTIRVKPRNLLIIIIQNQDYLLYFHIKFKLKTHPAHKKVKNSRKVKFIFLISFLIFVIFDNGNSYFPVIIYQEKVGFIFIRNSCCLCVNAGEVRE